jgi:tryptophanyl-tRNA synthetase
VCALPDFLNDLAAEGRQVIRVATGDEAVIGHDLLVDPIAPGVADVGLKRRIRRHRAAPENVGLSFYPAMQATHLLLPQLVMGRHPTLVPVAVDQDPHVRVCRDIAAKERFDVDKPAALLGKFLPSLDGPGKMSSSDEAPAIELTDDRETVRETVMAHAHSGGRVDVDEHRERGGDPEVDVAFQYLRAFFEPDDERLAEIAADYRAGDLLTGELKALAADAVADFLEAHRDRRAALGDLATELDPYRLRPAERGRLRPTVFE